MKQLLERAEVSCAFRKQVLAGLSTPGGCFHPETSSPKSSPVFLFALGLCGCYHHVTPVALALELCLAACDLLDSIEDEEGSAGLPQAQALNLATAFLLLNHMSLGRLWEENEPAKARQAAQALEVATVRSCQGQSLDLAFESRATVTEQEYLQMIQWKASSLMSCACSVGALLSTNEERKIEAAAQYGNWLGMARQMINDALAIVSGEHKSDIRRRKKTLPVIYALEKAQGSDREFLHRVYGACKPPGLEEQARVQRIILGSGGVHYAMVLADIYRQRAVEQIESTGVTTDIGDRLRALASF